MQENQVVINISYPPVIGYQELSQLLDKTTATLQADLCRCPEKLPPPIRIPGQKSPRWLLSDVINWLAQYREKRDENQQVEPQKPTEKRRRGRPTKAEQIVRRAALAVEGGGGGK
ncbi:MAG: DNA-binding protein [Rhodocyclaceae bacterium]|nr:DNA-binding protein [Rhodocyclaceae bacterium]